MNTSTKTKTYRALLIDPLEQKVSEFETEGTATAIRQDLSFPGHSCEDFASYGLSDSLSLLVDSEAALTANLPYFTLKNGMQFFGRALLLRATSAGNPTSVPPGIAAKIASIIIWPDKSRSLMWKLSDGNNVVPDADAVPISREDAIEVVEITEDELWKRLRGGAA